MISQKEHLSRLAGPLSKKERFTRREDLKLKQLVAKFSTDNWKIIAEHLKPRTPRQCRERWCNYINPKLSHDPWSADEDDILIKLHYDLGNHWKEMQKYLPKRSKNDIKKRWNYLKKLSQVDDDLLKYMNKNYSLDNKKEEDSQNFTQIAIISSDIKDIINESNFDSTIFNDQTQTYPIVKRYSKLIIKNASE